MKKKKMFFLVFLASVLSVVLLSAHASAANDIWDGKAAEGFASGTGTESDPYIIQTGAQLAYLAERVNAGTSYKNKYFLLVNDLYLNDTADWEAWGKPGNRNAWTPIGTYRTEEDNRPFRGTFNGDNHVIYGMYISSSESSYQGLFGYSKGTIQNLGLEQSYVITQSQYAGFVCSYNDGGTIRNCYSFGKISGTWYIGGVCGYNNTGTVTDCYNSGAVSGNYHVGGVCGYNNGRITSCYDSGTVSGVGYYLGEKFLGGETVGGVCGYNAGAIIGCYNSGTVSGSDSVGGVCGYNDDGTISSCYNTGTVSGSGRYVGGMCGWNDGAIASCYYLTGCAKDGNGMVQYGIGNKTKGETTADVSGKTAGLSDAELKLQSSFVGFDFCGTWAIEPSTGYEYPQFIGNVDASLYSGAATWDGTVADGFASGSGTETDPYIIEPAEQLAYLAKTVNNGTSYAGKFIKLANDIVLSNTEIKYWGYSATKWTPIGTYKHKEIPFSGTFDGDGHAVYGIYTDSIKDYQGLFGYSKGTIQNLGVEKSYICGSSNVGGVCGYNNGGTIRSCYNTGAVSGSSYDVGGVCGKNSGTITRCYNMGTASGGDCIGGVCGNNWDGTTTDCYNTGAVSGSSHYVGGVCGYNYNGTIKDCYNTGTVSGSGSVGGVCGWNGGTITGCHNTGMVSGSVYVGGVCGYNSSSTITNCYYLSGCAKDGNGTMQFGIGNKTRGGTTADVSGSTTGLSDAELKLQSSFVGFDFCGIWAIEPSTGYEYPQFIENVDASGKVDASLYSGAAIWDGTVADGFASGSGTETDPYIIETAEQLAYLAKTVNDGTSYTDQFIKLANDIVLSNTKIKYWGYSATAWTPIGREQKAFSGTFDGDNHCICGIYINNCSASYQGLFGHSAGTIKNLGVEKSYICGSSYVGGVCGYNNYNGTIKDCYNTGTVSGSSDVGGVCGYNNYNGTITGCYNTGTVSGTDWYGGGVCGENLGHGTISNCYNTGTVSGSGEYVGGVCGLGYGTISNCYNIGTVSGSSNYVGGVCGYNYGTITDCYYLSGCAKDSNATGLSDAAMKLQASFVGFDFDTVWTIGVMPGYDYPTLRWLKKTAEHTHVFDQMIVDSRYLKSPATCTKKAIYYYSCTCGAVGDETFESGDLLPHTYNQQNTDEKYLASRATKRKDATYYYSCICGAIGSEVFALENSKLPKTDILSFLKNHYIACLGVVLILLILSFVIFGRKKRKNKKGSI